MGCEDKVSVVNSFFCGSDGSDLDYLCVLRAFRKWFTLLCNGAYHYKLTCPDVDRKGIWFKKEHENTENTKCFFFKASEMCFNNNNNDD